jgi:signal peptidase II
MPALVIVLLDQVTKFCVLRSLSLYDSVPVIPGLVNIVHTRNRGMAFGILNRSDGDWSTTLLLLATLGAMVFICIWFTRLGPRDKALTLSLSTILGGAAGNFIDRVRMGEVIDFIDVYLGTRHWPAFNVADSAITVGTLGLALLILFQKQPTEENS